MSRTRLWIAVVLVASTGVMAQAVNRSAAAVEWRGASELPLQIGRWSGAEAAPISAEILRQLSADGIVNRVYVDGDAPARDDGSDVTATSASVPVQLYIAYYGRQRPGVSIHSPLHCLPGTGWDVQSTGSVDLAAAGAVGEARRLIAQKNRDRALVLYWYDVHGRNLDSELASRFYLVGDRLTLGRNDAALVRVVVPSTGDEAAAEQHALAFIRDMLPHLPKLWS